MVEGNWLHEFLRNAGCPLTVRKPSTVQAESIPGYLCSLEFGEKEFLLGLTQTVRINFYGGLGGILSCLFNSRKFKLLKTPLVALSTENRAMKSLKGISRQMNRILLIHFLWGLYKKTLTIYGKIRTIKDPAGCF